MKPGAPMAEPRLTAIEWQAVVDAMLFTVRTAGLVSDAHLRAQPKVMAMRDAAVKREAGRG